ncbi:MAG: plasmid pRiA4b ORF-3 family protein [Myxococcota bacterium]|nr:plasmid pRiA4b ORF-3 family protein [Myxococcota bacterium]
MLSKLTGPAVRYRVTVAGCLRGQSTSRESGLDEDRVRIGDVLLRRGDSMLYVYDFGDDWRHTIELEEVVPTASIETLPRCTDGRGEAPPEDSGPAGRAGRASRRIDVAQVNAALDWLCGRKR